MNHTAPIYDSRSGFTTFEPVGPLTERRIDPFASQLILLQQDYVVHSNFFRAPAYGCTHHTNFNATLVNASQSTDIGGGLVRITCTFVQGAPATFNREAVRTFTFPGIEVPQLTAKELYNETEQLRPSQWVSEQISFRPLNSAQEYFQINFIKEQTIEKERDIILRNVILREPQAITVNVTEQVTYCTTASPVGATITGGQAQSNVRNSRVKRRGENITVAELNGIPNTQDAFVIYGNAGSQAETNVRNELEKKKSAGHIDFAYEIPTIATNAQISEYLSESSRPTINEYFLKEKIYLQSTQIEQVNGALYKYTDIFTTPR